MLARFAKRAIHRAAAWFGYEIRRIGSSNPMSHGIGSMEHFLRFLHQLGVRPRCILDVGANQASWSALAAKVFPGARFVLIEPQEEMLSHLTAFCASHPSARYVPAGAGAEPGQAIQTIWADLQGSSFLPALNDEYLRAGRQRKTPIVTIDSVFAEEEWLPDIVKLDIQGFELEALKGANRLFGHTECFVLEVALFQFMPGMPDLFEVVEFMHQRGYKFYDICGFVRRPLDGALGQLDVAFAKANGRLCGDARWVEELEQFDVAFAKQET
jgi:FkbM family methyltransferase